MKIGMSLGMRGQRGLTQIQRAIAFLRTLGTSAHVWAPGSSGVSVASLPSENYLLSDFSTGYSGVDAVVGGVKDGMNPSGGISLTQATTANKPLVRRGMLNLLTYSNTLTDASWLKGGGGAITYNAVGVDGAANTAATITTTTAVFRSITRGTGATSVAGAAFSTAFWLKKTTGALARYPVISLEEVSLTRLLGICTVDTSNGVVTAWSAYTGYPINSGSAVSIASSGDYWLVTLSGFCSGATTTIAGLFPAGASTSTQSTGAITGAVGPDVICGGSLLTAGTWTAAQILAEGGIPTTTATAASNPTSGKYWWSFNHADIVAPDSLLSGNLGITNACTIVIAGRVNSLPANTVLFGEDVNGVQISIASNGAVSFTKKAVVILVTSPAAEIVANIPFVLTCRLSTGTAAIRKLGTQVATAATAQVFAATTGARIGSAFDTTLPAGGALGWVVPLPVALSDADCLKVERLAASQFPNGPIF